MNTRFFSPLILSAAAFGGAATSLSAEVYSPVAAAFQSTAPASTDSLVSMPVSRPAVYIGGISAVTGTTLTVLGTPGWTPGAFAADAGNAPHYVRLLSGALAGQALTVVTNGTNTLTVEDAGLNLAQVAPDDRVELVPYWTLGTLYPASSAGVAFTPSTSPVLRGTEILLPNHAGTGINRAPSSSFYFFNGAWRRVGSVPAQSFDRTVLPPDTYHLHRNKATATLVTRTGWVAQDALATVLETAAATANDNYVALAFPESVTLGNSNLIASGAVMAGDQVLLYTAGQTGINRIPSQIYYHAEGAWRKVGASTTESFDQVLLPAGEGFIVRKAAGASPAVWTFESPL